MNLGSYGPEPSTNSLACREYTLGWEGMNALLWPNLGYRDARAAIRFLVTAFGFEEVVVYDGEDGDTVGHAELRWPGGGGVTPLLMEDIRRTRSTSIPASPTLCSPAPLRPAPRS